MQGRAEVVSGAASAGLTGDRALGGVPRRADTDASVWDDFDAATCLGSRRRAAWEKQYLRKLVILDLVLAVAAGAFGYVFRFDDPSEQTMFRHLGFAAVLPVLWLLLVAANRGYEKRFLYVGSEETRRILRSGLMLIAGVSFTAYAFKINFSRGYMLGSLPLLVAGSAIGRYILRKRLHWRRSSGACMERTIVVGHPVPAADMAKRLSRRRHHGLEVVAACLPQGLPAEPRLGDTDVPVVGRIDDIVRAVTNCGAAVVIVLSCPEIGGDELRRLSWKLEHTGASLLVAPALVEVAGPRTSVRLAAGLPLLHVEPPEFSGFRRLAKSTFDRVLAAAGLLAICPLLCLIAIAVRLEGAGPVIFRQVRVGKHGEIFTLLKFRTMYLNADAEVAKLRELHDREGLPFKTQGDPRVTRVGKVLRRYSLDELPQVINVVQGEMSLVGPRPLLPGEVSDADLRRRLVVPPGMTGLWQVSGRSDMPWEERMQIDLYYVENWSPALDFLILARTARAVVRAQGAY